MATSLPILPRPRIPRIFPFNSVPMNYSQTVKEAKVSIRSEPQALGWGWGRRGRLLTFFRSHLPFFMDAVAWGICLQG